MSSPASTVAPPSVRLSTDVPLRRSGWMFVGSLVLFVIGLALMSINVDRFEAEQAAADDLGVSIHDVPATVLAPIAQEHSSVGMEIATSLPAVLGFVLLVLGTWVTTRGAGNLARLARVGAVASLLGFAGGQSVFLSLYADQEDVTWVWEHFGEVVSAATAVSVMAGCLCIVAVVLVLRARAVARRTGVVVGALAALSFVAAPVPAVGGMPPLLPCFLAMILGIVMIRTSRASHPRP